MNRLVIAGALLCGWIPTIGATMPRRAVVCLDADVELFSLSERRVVAGVIDTDHDGTGNWHFGAEFPLAATNDNRSLPDWGVVRGVRLTLAITPNVDTGLDLITLELEEQTGLGRRVRLEAGPTIPSSFSSDGASLLATGPLNLFVGWSNYLHIGRARSEEQPEFWSPLAEDKSIDQKTECDSGGPGAQECKNSNCSDKACRGCAGISCQAGYYACCVERGQCACVKSSAYGEPVCGGFETPTIGK